MHRAQQAAEDADLTANGAPLADSSGEEEDEEDPEAEEESEDTSTQSPSASMSSSMALPEACDLSPIDLGPI